VPYFYAIIIFNYLTIFKLKKKFFIKRFKTLFYSDCLEVGDIILVSSIKKMHIVKIGQKIINKNNYNSNYIHAILFLGKNIFIESMPKLGVKITCMDELEKRLKNKYKILRKKNLSNDEKKEIFNSGLYFYKQSYNLNIFSMEHRNDASFCSELIYKIFKKANINLNCRIFQQKFIWPSHLGLLDKNCKKEWKDITDSINKCNEEFLSREYSQASYDLTNYFCKLIKNNLPITNEIKYNCAELTNITFEHLRILQMIEPLRSNQTKNTLSINFEFKTLRDILELICSLYKQNKQKKELKWFKLEKFKKNHYIFNDHVYKILKLLEKQNQLFNDFFHKFNEIASYLPKQTNYSKEIYIKELKKDANILKNKNPFKWNTKKTKKDLNILQQEFNVITKKFCINNQNIFFNKINKLIDNIEIFNKIYSSLKNINL